ncbi:MAG: class I SAM-dependent methyltransferase [Anaerolineaceae bacterium]|nr:class I SAM-dependent methyltransferase [Anaerolineaceae bacterium]
MAQQLNLRSGMRVLDLCCGNCSSSIFLAKQYGVNVIVADNGVNPTDNWERIKSTGLSKQIIPLKLDAKNLLLPEGYFDVSFCLISYFYFGTEDTYLDYLIQFLQDNGKLGIASPCYAAELKPDTPREFLYDAPDYIESYTVHSPSWWQQHFNKSDRVNVLRCEENPKGRAYWLDDVHWLLETHHSNNMKPEMKSMLLQEIEMLLKDETNFVTYLTLIAEKLEE